MRRVATFAAVMVGMGLSARAGLADTIAVPRDHATIQAAIDAAADGDTIVVGRGTYAENVVVNGRSDLTIRGKGAPEVDGGSGGDALTISSSARVVVTGLRFRRGVNGVRVTSSQDVTLSRCAVEGPSADGVRVEGGLRVRVERSVVESCGDNGVALRPAATPSSACVVTRCAFASNTDDAVDVIADDTEVSRNRIAGGENGVRLEGARNLVDRNRIAATGDDSVDVRAEATDAVVTRNRIDGSRDDGVRVEGDGARIEGNKISHPASEGIRLLGAADGNVLVKNKVAGSTADGILVNGNGNTLDGNGVVGSREDGIEVDGTGNTFTGNKVKGAAANGFLVESGGNTFRGNSATGSGAFDLSDTSGAGSGNVYEDNRFGTTSP